MRFFSLAKRRSEEHPAVLKFQGFARSLQTLFHRGVAPSTRLTGLALLTYYLNPFGIIPPAHRRSRFFDEIYTVADNLRQLYRGGLFRRGDED